MISVSPETWQLLWETYEGGAFAREFDSAWSNGVAFLQARDGLRGRRPLVIEWKGNHRAPGDEVAPIDLRVDHVFMVSCKYLSRILINASPFRLFERLLEGGHGTKERDWYRHTAPFEYQALYEGLCRELCLESLPHSVEDLSTADRHVLAQVLKGAWPKSVEERHEEFVSAVSEATARQWRQKLERPNAREALLWRLLRMGSAPYFVLGSSPATLLRIRVATPWDWRSRYRLRELDVSSQAGGQPRVRWMAFIEDRHSRALHEVAGHVEIRWAHGRFSGNPEAKVYLDTPHRDVPGYYELT